MVIEYTPPTRASDMTGALLTAMTGAAPILAQDYFGAIGTIGAAFRQLTPQEDPTPGALAWTWRAETLTQAATDLWGHVLRDLLDRGQDRQWAGTTDEAVKAFLDAALPVPPKSQFSLQSLENPAEDPTFAPARKAITQLVLDLTHITKFADGQEDGYTLAFKDALNRASVAVAAKHHADLASLMTALNSASEPMKRELQWTRHAHWIRQQFDTAPVFSPKGDVKTPLKHIYLRPRCTWHSEIRQTSEDRDAPKRYQGHVADMHATVHDWLDAPADDNIRLIAGGPGSGKSSFARSFATELLAKRTHRVMLFELQRMRLSNEIGANITDYLRDNHDPIRVEENRAMPPDAMDWIKADVRPTLLIFDGLDEISYREQDAKDIAKKFISLLCTRVLTSYPTAKALVLGRDQAIAEAMEEAHVPVSHLLHVAPIRAVGPRDMVYGQRELKQPDWDKVPEAVKEDQRDAYWKNWTAAIGQAGAEMPPSVKHGSLKDMNVEPLLLHLLLLSDYATEKWELAAENRNRVYADILSKIHGRDKAKGDPGIPYEKLSEPDFFMMMEVLGLTALRVGGGGRYGDEKTFEKVRSIHARHRRKDLNDFAHTDMRSVVLKTHARPREGNDPGFEFIHKSFGEYLAARGLISAAIRCHVRLTKDDSEDDAASLCKTWAELIHDAELTHPVVRFLYDEGHLAKERLGGDAQAIAVKSTLQEMLNWVQIHGFPVHEVTGEGNYRELETRQRQSELLLFATASSLASSVELLGDPEEGANPSRMNVDWTYDNAAVVLHRLHTPFLTINRRVLCRANLYEANLRGATFFRANLSGADLSEANLSRADFFVANLARANFVGAYLSDANLASTSLHEANLCEADLSGANLYRAFLTGANLCEADLRGANLNRAELQGAKLESADLTRCTLTATRVRSVDFTVADNFDPNAVKLCFGVRSGIGLTKLPDGVTYPDHWHVAADAEQDGPEHLLAFEKAYQKWLADQGL